MTTIGDRELPLADTPPATFAELRELLASGEVKLPKRLKQVAAFALAQPDEIALKTIARIAEDAGVQPSTLVRFGQALGFAGFTDLQAVFRDRLRNHVSNYDERMLSLRARDGNVSKSAVVFDWLCEAATRSIGALHERTDLDLLDEASRILAAAETIYLIGQRRSFPVTSYMNYALGKLGIRNTLIGSAAGTDAETISFATPRDAAIAISFTPYASTTVTYAKEISMSAAPAAVQPATAPAAAATQSAPRDYLTVALGEDLFAIPVSLVHEVLDPAPVTRVPNAPAFAPGLVNVRGNVLPMLDLRVRFGLEPAADTPSTRLIVSEVAIEGGDPFEVAIKTDAVFAVVPVRDEEIAAVPEYGSRWPTRFLAGVVRDEGRFVLLLDVARLVETH